MTHKNKMGLRYATNSKTEVRKKIKTKKHNRVRGITSEWAPKGHFYCQSTVDF